MTCFVLWLQELLSARYSLDGIQLQKLQSQIIDAYQINFLNDKEYKTLISIYEIFMNDYRKLFAK